MSNNKSPINWWAFIGFVLVFLLICIVLLSGCEVIKGKRSFSQDTASVKKKSSALIDTGNGGNVKKQNISSREDFDWWRMTQQFGKDTLNNVTNVYPSTIIYEGGKGSKEQTTNTIDSSWFKNALSQFNASIDSMNNKIATMEKNKQSETKGVGLIMVILIAVGAVVSYALFRYFTKSFSIVKKAV